MKTSKKLNKEHLTLFIGVIVIFALFVSMFVILGIQDNTKKSRSSYPITLSGQYKISNGAWQKYDINHPIEKGSYNDITVKGKLQEPLKKGGFLIVKMNNVWTQIKVDGKIVASNLDYKNKTRTNSPGYSISYIDENLISDISIVEISMSNPYSLYGTAFYSNVLNDMVTGDKDALYDELYTNHFFELIIACVIIFLGLFSFTLAGAIFTEVKFKYLSFSLVAVFGGAYILTDVLGKYLPLWISNPTMCTFIDESTAYLLAISCGLYMRANLKRNPGRLSMSVITGVFIVISAVAVILQLLGIQDILATEVFMFLPFIATFIVGIIFLVIGGFRYGNTSAKFVAISFCPILLAVMYDVYVGVFDLMPQPAVLHCAIFIAIVIQIIQLIRATKQSYDRSIKFQKMQKELLESRVLIMISQIQPHFLYNALTSIAQLCEKDPKRAKKATIEFADYLRGNMNSLKDNHPVPFETELKHLETYLSLEKMRFGDDLNVKYDINCLDFLIPSLTVQPLVENAVKHGVGMKEDGGTVTIATRELDDAYEVIVSDDGVGFDTTMPNPDTSRTHIGIDNIKDRLSSMCNAEVTIESEIGVGTTSTIRIPKEKE